MGPWMVSELLVAIKWEVLYTAAGTPWGGGLSVREVSKKGRCCSWVLRAAEVTHLKKDGGEG